MHASRQRTPRVVAVGELLVEFIPVVMGQRHHEPGPVEKVASGAAGIYACAAARLGAQTTMLAVVGEDGFSRLAVGELAAHGVDTGRIATVAGPQIGLVFPEYVGDVRHFIYYRDDSAGSRLSADDIPADVVGAADVVHFPGNVLFSSPSLREACLRAVELAAASPLTMLSVDPNIRLEMVKDPAELQRVHDVIAQARFVKPSDVEAELLTGQTDPAAACRELLAMGPELVAVTLGERGCVLGREGEVVQCEPYRVECKDPTGAGDVFSAAVAVGLTSGWPLDRLARFANAAGALATTAVGHIGKAIPTREDVERLAASQSVRCGRV